jgi:hypothetical protein
MPLLFIFCCLYPKRFEKIIPLGIILFLLAHTNAYATVITIAIGLSLFTEALFRRKVLFTNPTKTSKLIFGFSLFIIGVVFFVLYMNIFSNKVIGVYTATSEVSNLFVTAKNMLRPIILPGRYFSEVLGFKSEVFTSLVIWIILLTLLRKPYIFLILFFGIVGMCFFKMWFSAPLSLRHEGMLIILIVAVFWIDQKHEQTQKYPERINRFLNIFSDKKQLLLVVLLVIQLCNGVTAIRKEIFHKDFSSSKSLGNLIKNNPKLSKAIIIGEPSAPMESLPYYVDNKIYIPREKRYGNFVNFTPEKRNLSLKELISIVKKIKRDRNAPVLIAMGHELDKNGPFKYKIDYVESFTYDLGSLGNFINQTTKIGSFRNARREKYDVFLFQ